MSAPGRTRGRWWTPAGAACAAALSACASAPPPEDPVATSFFVTSTAPGSGNLEGLAGADAHCQALATAAGSPKREWRAYLSAPGAAGQSPVHARDRIGRGPWQNAVGVEVAANVAELHGESNGLGLSTSLDERGRAVRVGLHDMLTGSNPDGTLAIGDSTCRGWTSTAGYAMVGHHNEGGGERQPTWNSAHSSSGCTALALKSSDGAGLFYCFAAD